jgi:hypothetical protein
MGRLMSQDRKKQNSLLLLPTTVAAATLVLLMPAVAAAMDGRAAGRRVGRCVAAMDVPTAWTDGAVRRGGERAAQRGESGVVAVSGAEGNEMLVGNSLGDFF